MASNEDIRVDVVGGYDGSDKINQATNDIEKLGKSASSTGGKLSGGTNSIRSFVNSLSDINGALNTASRQWNQIMRSYNRTLVNGLKDAGREIKQFAQDAIENYTKLSEQHAKTTGAMYNNYSNTSKGQKQFAQDSKALEKQALNIAKTGTTGDGSLYKPEQISNAQTELVKAGVPTKAILNDGVLETILNFAQANDLETGSAVEFAVSLGNQFGVKYKNWGNMLDKVSHAADLSTIDVSDVVQSMKYAGGITSGLNKSIDEVLAMVAEMGNFGLKGSQSGSAIQALYTRLLTGDTTVITDSQKEVAPSKALKAFYDFSKYAKSDGSDITYDQIKNAKSYKSLGKLSGNLRPMDEVVDKLDDVMSDLNDEEQAWFAKKFFGLYQMKGAYALINGSKNSESFDNYKKRIKEESTGTNKNKLQQLLDSQYGKNTTLANLWETTKTDVGSDLSPFINSIRDELFNYIQNNGDYDIDVNNIKDAMDKCSDTIGDKYGESIGELTNKIGNTTIDLSYVATKFSPKIGSGIANVLNKFADGDITGMMSEWNTMISDLDMSTEDLPENLQAMGEKVVNLIDIFGKLTAINIGSKIIEAVTSTIKAITIAGGAIIKAGSVVVDGGTGGMNNGTGGSVIGGSGNTNKTSTGGSTVSGSGKTSTTGGRISNGVNFIGSTLASVGGAYLGSKTGEYLVSQFTDDETSQMIGSIAGGMIGGSASYKISSSIIGSLTPVIKSAAETAYIKGLYGIETIAPAVSNVASVAAPTAGIAGGLYVMYDSKKQSDQRKKDNKEVSEMDSDENPLFDNDGKYLRNSDGSIKTDKNMNSWDTRISGSDYAYAGYYNDNERQYISNPRPEEHFWNKDEVEEWDKHQQELDNAKEKDEEYFYNIQNELFNRSGIKLRYSDYSKDGNKDTLKKWYDSIGTKSEIDFSTLNLGKDATGTNIKDKFTTMSTTWVNEYMNQIHKSYSDAGVNFDMSKFKASNMLKGIYAAKDPRTVVEKNIQEYIGKKNIDKYTKNLNKNPAEQFSGNSPLTPNISDLFKNAINNANAGTNQQNVVNNEVQKSVQVNDNSSINIQPVTTPVTVQPNITIDVNVDKDGKVTLSQSQQNTLFNMMTNFNVNKSRSYNTSGKTSKKKE